MSPFMRTKIISLNLIFRGRVLGEIGRIILKNFFFPLLKEDQRSFLNQHTSKRLIHLLRIRKFTQKSLYPLSNHLLFHKFSLTHKTFPTS
ncbi:hypothetical protein CR513_25755, partial [Mucuna pruriens]